MQLVARECSKCGAKLAAAPATSVVLCKYCGTEHAVLHADPAVQAGVTSAVRSEDTGSPVSVTFASHRGSAVDLYWLDFEGAEKPYGRLEPGAKSNFNTYVGHVWSLRDAASGTELLRWAAPDPTARTVPVR